MKKRILSVFLLALLALASYNVSDMFGQWQLPTGSVYGSANPDQTSEFPTAMSASGNLVSITVANPAATGVAPGQSFTLSGVVPAVYNGLYVALTASTTTITALSATATGTVTSFGVLQTPAIGPGGLVTMSANVATVAPGPLYCPSSGQEYIPKTNFTLNYGTTYNIFFRCPTGQLIASTTSPTAIDVPLASVVVGSAPAITGGTYTSGGTLTNDVAGTYCGLTSFNGGGNGAFGYLPITSAATIAANTPIVFLNFGQGYTSGPTTATGTLTGTPNPAVTCSGTITIATTYTAAGTTTVTDLRPGNSQYFPPSTDFAWYVPLHDCALGVPNTGALATASTIGENVGIVYAAANNPVLQIKTSAAANIPVLDCDITPMMRTQGSRGFTVNMIEEKYGYQTTAPTSIDTPTLSTVLGAASGNSTAAGTVAAAGGTLYQNVGTSHSSPGATTTTGLCFTEDTIPTTPVLMTNPLMRLTWEHTFHQTASAATVLQICGVVVYGSYIY